MSGYRACDEINRRIDAPSNLSNSTARDIAVTHVDEGISELDRTVVRFHPGPLTFTYNRSDSFVWNGSE